MISPITAVLMIMFALVFDALQAVATFFLVGIVFNPLISFVAYLIFFLWFTLFCGVKFKGKKLTGPIASFLIELIPLINMVPGITLGVAITIGLNWKDSLATKGGVVGKVVSKGASRRLEKLAEKRKKSKEENKKEESPAEKAGEKPEREGPSAQEPPAPGSTARPEPPVGQEIRPRLREPLRKMPNQNFVGKKTVSET